MILGARLPVQLQTLSANFPSPLHAMDLQTSPTCGSASEKGRTEIV